MERIIIFIYRVLMQAVRIYSFVWFIWIVMSWLNSFGVIQVNYYNGLIRFLHKITDGVIDKLFGRFRDRLVVGNMDLSPFVFLILLTTVFPIILGNLLNLILRLL